MVCGQVALCHIDFLQSQAVTLKIRLAQARAVGGSLARTLSNLRLTGAATPRDPVTPSHAVRRMEVLWLEDRVLDEHEGSNPSRGR